MSTKTSLWQPRHAWWWMGVLFAIGSTCFLLGPIPAFLDLVGPQVDGLVFFVGSIFFTSAATLQLRESVQAGHALWQPHSRDWWSSAVQWVGTLFFNATTLHGLTNAISAPSYDKLVWRPDAYGSVCFLVSGLLAYVEVTGGIARRPHGIDGAIAAVNLFGCVAFGVAALGAYVLPSSQEQLDTHLANLTTSVGGLAFLVGSLLLLQQRRAVEPAPVPGQ